MIKDKGLQAKVAAITAERKSLDQEEKAYFVTLRKEREKLDAKLETLIVKELALSIPSAIQDENFGYSDYEELGDPAHYHFSVSLERIYDDVEEEDCEEDDEDDKPVKAPTKRHDKSKQWPGALNIQSYDSVLECCRAYGINTFSYNDCTVSFRRTSIEIASTKSRAAVMDLLSEWRVPINLAKFMLEIEGLESQLRSRRECFDKLQTTMLFTVGK